MYSADDRNAAFQRIIEEHKRIIYRVCYMYAVDSEHLQDLYQEVTANVWQGLGSFRGKSKESTWVYRIALNTCITEFRRNDRHRHMANVDLALTLPGDDGSEHASLLRQMYELISKLGKLDKALIMLWLDEYSYDEIAELTGLTRNNVASRLMRARQKLIKLSNE